jgi:hypothetical protein
VRATILFEASPLRLRWRRHHVASPGSILEIGFRLVNLYAAAFAGCPGIPAVCGGVDGLGGVGGGGGQSAGEGGALVRAQDAGGVREAARRIEADLVSWREGAPRGWRFDTVDSDPGAVDAEAGFGGKTHVYANLWIAEAWNNWRALRLVLNQIIARNEARAGEPDEALRVAAEEVVREMSAEVCVSVANFVGTPRRSSVHRWVPARLTGFRSHFADPTAVPRRARGAEQSADESVRGGHADAHRCCDGGAAGWSDGQDCVGRAGGVAGGVWLHVRPPLNPVAAV